MTIKPSLLCSTAALAASCTVFCAAAGAQSLAMSYNLDPVSADAPQKAPSLVDRCAGLTWATSLAARCNSGPFALLPPAPPAASVEAVPAVAEATDSAQRKADFAENVAAGGETFSGFSLPILGSAGTDARLLRAASANEVPAESGKTLDLLFRFASKYRLSNTEEGWAVTRFKDVTSENRTQASGVKAVGVELLFPFQ
jgi:hypothetical protein